MVPGTSPRLNAIRGRGFLSSATGNVPPSTLVGTTACGPARPAAHFDPTQAEGECAEPAAVKSGSCCEGMNDVAEGVGPIFIGMAHETKSVTWHEAEELYGEEWAEWYRLTPQERWLESERLWATFLALGGSLDPEPDPQSPFDVAFSRGQQPLDGRAGVRVVRRGGV
jgi:hypothetical protein